MTPRQIKEGRKVKLSDPVKAFVRFSRGTTPPVAIGAAGNPVPRAAFDMVAEIASHGVGKTRVLIYWPNTYGGHVGLWVDADMIEGVRA